MLISLREAGDLSLQITLAAAAIICGTSVAMMAARSEPKTHEALDLSRPVLWESGPVRIDRQEQILTITVRPPAAQTASNTCSDAIGLRVACDLVAANRRPSQTL